VQTVIDSSVETRGPWTFRVHRPTRATGRVILLIHGWTGDENSMWIFTRALPSDAWILAPRAPYPERERGGYSWRNRAPGVHGFPTFEELRPSAEALLDFVDAWRRENALPDLPFGVAGFSQGAAMVHTLIAIAPKRLRRAAALSGFVPEGAAGAIPPLEALPYFLAHGTADPIVPFEKAEHARRILESKGASVTFCSDEVAHKVGARCMKSLKTFFSSEPESSSSP